MRLSGIVLPLPALRDRGSFLSAHGIMFHHFFGGRHARGQGAISADQLEAILAHLGRDRVLPAHEWLRRALAGSLGENDLCLTFDDALKCQYDIAVPVLKRLNLTAFWSVYSGVFQGRPEVLEIYRHFRMTEFSDLADFYAEFSGAARTLFPQDYAAAMDGFDARTYLAAYPFYTESDRIFRYLRDDVLGAERYQDVISGLMRRKNFDPQAASTGLWMSDDEIRELDLGGHIIGLHSFSHPTRLAELDPAAQRAEYRQNFDHLLAVLGKPPTSMSHPCNSYSRETFSILQGMGIKLGFRSNMAVLERPTMYEFPREDQANLIRAIQEKSAAFSG